MGALILSLQAIGWKPIGPAKWQNPKGEDWDFKGDRVDVVEMMNEMEVDIIKPYWQKAATHYQGSGLEQGADLKSARRHVRWLQKKGKHKEAGCLRGLVCANIWPGERKLETRYDVDPVCPRCGKATETAQHRFWECEHNGVLFDQWNQDLSGDKIKEDAAANRKRIKLATSSTQRLAGVMVPAETAPGDQEEHGRSDPQKHTHAPDHEQTLEEALTEVIEEGWARVSPPNLDKDVQAAEQESGNQDQRDKTLEEELADIIEQNMCAEDALDPKSKGKDAVARTDSPGSEHFVYKTLPDFDNAEEDVFDQWDQDDDPLEYTEQQQGWEEMPEEYEDTFNQHEDQDEHLPDEQHAKVQGAEAGGEKKDAPKNPYRLSPKVAAMAKADLDSGRNQSFWIRGIVPQVQGVPQDTPVEKVMKVGQQTWETLGSAILAFIDGSGTHPDPRIRRCGWGVAWLHQTSLQAGSFKGGLFGSFGEEAHTVAKAELEALLRALSHIEWQDTGIIIFSDCKFVVNGFQRRVWRTKEKMAYADRWAKIGQLVEGRSNVDVVWVKAHVTQEAQMVRKIDSSILAGNECADALAKRGAKLAQLTHGTKEKIVRMERMAWSIRRRNAAIQDHVNRHYGEEGEDRVERQKAHKARQEAIKRKRQDEAATFNKTLKVQEPENKRKWPEEPACPEWKQRILQSWKKSRGIESDTGTNLSHELHKVEKRARQDQEEGQQAGVLDGPAKKLKVPEPESADKYSTVPQQGGSLSSTSPGTPFRDNRGAEQENGGRKFSPVPRGVTVDKDKRSFQQSSDQPQLLYRAGGSEIHPVRYPSSSHSSASGHDNASGGMCRDKYQIAREKWDEAANKQREAAQVAVQKVRDEVHRTHLLKTNLEIGWCSKCGCFVSLGDRMRLYDLAKECWPGRERGKQNLRKIVSGVNPKTGQPFLQR